MDEAGVRRLLAEIEAERQAADAALGLIGPTGRRALEAANAAGSARRHLRAMGAILELYREEVDLQRRTLIRAMPTVLFAPWALERIAAPHALDDELLNAFAEVLDAAVAAYPVTAPRDLHRDLAPHVARMQQRLNEALPDALRHRLLRTVSHAAALTGWAAMVGGERDRARQHFRLADSTAAYAGDGSLRALALEGRSNLDSAAFLGRSEPSRLALDALTQAVAELGLTTPGVVKQWVLGRYGQELALAGSPRADQYLDAAASVYAGGGEGIYRLGGFFDADAQLGRTHGNALVARGRPEAAEQVLNASLALVPVEKPHKHAGLLAYLAGVRVAQHEPAEAARVALRALRLANGASAPTVQRVQGVAERLAPWANLHEVLELDEALAVT